MENGVLTNEIRLRVSYADTDQMGMVYYANYLVYFERGRTEWLRSRGLPYSELESKGVFFPVVEASCRYHSPARYDDMLTVRTIMSAIGAASIEFSYEIRAEERLIATGTTRHPLVGRDFKPRRIPPEIRQLLERNDARENPDR